MLKVCQIITKLELGGAQKFTLYTAQCLDKNKFNSFLICGKGGMLDDEASEKTRVLKVGELVREISPLKDIRALYKIWRILKKEKPDVVHTHSSKAGIIGRIAAKLAGIKVIIHTIHGYSFNDTQKWHIKYLYIFLERFCSMFSDKLIVENNSDINKGLKYKIAKKDKFTIITSGIDTQYYKNYVPNADFRNTLVRDPSAKIILTIGPFKHQKNLGDFIRAGEIVSRQFDNAYFFIVGDGELRPELEVLIEKLNLNNKITLLGWRRDIIELLSACDIFVMTSLWEGLPRTILDAMCCAKPVIANAVGGISDIIKDGENGFLTLPLIYSETAEKIIYLLNDEKLFKKIGENAKDSITINFDINYAVRQHENLYAEKTNIN